MSDKPLSLAQQLLAEATRAVSGEQRFWCQVGTTPRVFRLIVPAEADAHLQIRRHAAQLAAMKPTSAGPWEGLIPPDGISPDVAFRVARARACRLACVDTDTNEVSDLSERDLVALAMRAGGLFVSLTDEVGVRCEGARGVAEMEALEQAKND